MKRVCPECHGNGQTQYFKGESRFILSSDECTVCCGLGFIESQERPKSGGQSVDRLKAKGSQHHGDEE